MAVQKLKVQYHNRDSRGGFSDVLLSSRGGHGISVGDVIEVYHSEDVHHVLFLVTVLRDDIQTRDVISIESSLAQFFRLQQHKTACVRVVNKKSVSLDLVELHFREQYLSRSDCFRLSQELVGSVVQVAKKIEANDFRVQVGELWRSGEKYSCGYVGDKTKIVFRSSSASIHIFIQLSEEMWLFDDHGDLYFEKAIKFLSKLFLCFWPENYCSHDTNVIFFTRVYITDLPVMFHDRVNRDHSGRLYEDFYKVSVQNERFTTEEWKRVLTQLKLEFRTFQQDLHTHFVDKYPSPEAARPPKIHVSRANNGNFLEAINMALNFYSGYNVDRNFDRTGKLSFFLSPGTGCFMVERQLSEMTKQRILDLGVGIDLICFGQQPFHAVPMFQLVSPNQSEVQNDFFVPYWINCSFFRSAHELRQIEFGLPVFRSRIIPISKDGNICCLPPTQTQKQPFVHRISSPQRSTSMPFKKGTRSRTRVLRIFYPLHEEPKSSSNDFPNTSNDTIDQPSPGFLSSSSQATHSLTSTLSHSSVHAFGADAKRSVNPILTAISTAGAVSRARLDARRSSHGSESDYSPVRRGAEWNKETGAKFPSSLTQADFGGRETGTSEGKSAGHMMPARVMRVGSLSSSLNANRRGQPPLVNLEQAVCLNEMVARQRSESLNSTGNETLSNASSLDDRTTHGAARFHSRPEVGPWGLPRPLSYSGCGRDQITRVQTPLYVLLQTNMATPATATNGTPFGLSQKRFPISNSAARGFSRTISRVRTNSTLCPTLNPRNPFEIKLDKVTNVRSAGKGRWDLVRPRDERGLPLSPHRDLFAFRTLECLSLNTQVINLSQVWAAYFVFLRSKLKQCAPGGPDQFFPSTTTTTTASTVSAATNTATNTVTTILNYFPGLFEDGRKAATISKGHISRIAVSWLPAEMASSVAPRKRSECMLTECAKSVQTTLKPADPTLLQTISSYARRELGPPVSTVNETVLHSSTASSSNCSSGASQLLHAVRHAARNAFNCEQSNFFTVDHSLAEQRLTILKNTLRLIGIDWKSLSTPASLPIPVDFLPDAQTLKNDCYTLHEYRVVPYGYSPEEWESRHNFDKEPGQIYLRRPMTVREVFHEMVLQRLSHGFQLCQEPPVSNQSVVNTSGDHSSTTLSSPGPAVTSFSPPRFAKPVGKPTPFRSSVWPASSTDQRSSTTNTDNTQLTRRMAGSHLTIGTSTTAVSSNAATQSRMAARSRHINSRGAPDTSNMNALGTKTAVGIGSCLINQRNGSSVTGGLCRSLGVGLTLSQPVRATAIGARSLTAKGKRSESPAPGSDQPPDFGNFGKSSPTVVRLCMGRLFHSISLEEDSITLTNYRLRQDEERIQMEYKYSLCVPDTERFLQLRTVFLNEGTTMLNWSYLDNYLCTRGVSDSFVLLPSLKFWRARFMVLPVYTNETKRLADLIKERMSTGGPRVLCDVYETDYRAMDPVKMCEKFTHFIESINRVRRLNPTARKLLQQMPLDKAEQTFRSRELSGSGVHAAQSMIATGGLGCTSMSGGLNTTAISTTSLNSVATIASSGSKLPVALSNLIGTTTPTVTPTVTHSRPVDSGVFPSPMQNAETQGATGLPVEEVAVAAVSSTAALGDTSFQPGTTLLSTTSTTTTTTVQTMFTSTLISSSAPTYQVVSLMIDPDAGLPFIATASTSIFPERTFFSFDAVMWTIRTLSDMDSVNQAVDYLQTLVDTGWICHTSGNTSHPFIFGSYFYTLLAPDLKAYGVQGHGTSQDVLCSGTVSDGGEWTASSSSIVSSSSNYQPTGSGNLTCSMTTNSSHSAANLMNVTPVCDRLSDSVLQNGHGAWTTGPQPIPFPESFVPRATPGPNGSIIDFETEWLEIAFAQNALGNEYRPGFTSRIPPSGADKKIDRTTEFLSTISHGSSGADRTGFQDDDSVLRKSCICDLDDATVGDRTEWTHCVYDANYHPLCAFTLELQWLVASGSRLAELVCQWHHRARNNLHFFPVPCSPFEFPSLRSHSNPLRHPVFVPCRLDRLASAFDTAQRDHQYRLDMTVSKTPILDVTYVANQLFRDFPEENRLHMVRLFQDHLLYRFGFLPSAYDSCQVPPITARYDLEKPALSKRWTYVHCSGGMFVMIPTYGTKGAASTGAIHAHPGHTTSPNPNYTIRTETSTDETPTRLCHSRQLPQTWSKDTLVPETTGYTNETLKDQTEFGYFWAWNHMLPRRTRGYLTSDESFQDAMLADFRVFVGAEDDRLLAALTGFLSSVTNQQADIV